MDQFPDVFLVIILVTILQLHVFGFAEYIYNQARIVVGRVEQFTMGRVGFDNQILLKYIWGPSYYIGVIYIIIGDILNRMDVSPIF